jgi:hypothetical protein
MLDQLLNIVKQFGQDAVVNNPDVPNEENQNVMADASKTIANGFQNILAGGGFQSILDLFRGGKQSSSGGGIGGLIKNPIVSMMIGYFISKLVGKYKMSPSSASNVANSLIPNALNGLINQINDPNNPNATLDNLIGSLTGGGDQQQSGGGGSQLQDILDSFTGGGGGNSSGGGFDLQDIISSLTGKAQSSMENRESGGGGGGLLDMIKGFFK